ncbi:MAG: hypothetical protein ACRES8_07535 [Nevskiaceae bacterium]
MEGKNKALVFCASLTLGLPNAWAYKESTHADLAKQAIERSEVNVASTGILKALGIGESVREQRFIVPGSAGVPSPTSVEALVMRGARDEDHGKRPLNHFFDPQRDGKGLPTYDPSPTWALDTGDAEQQFALDDARRYLLSALTGPTEAQRALDLTRTFRAIGHVIHHIQDMHQPQHVRSDTHCDDSPVFFGWWLPNGCATPVASTFLYRPSAYEQYVWEQGAISLDGYRVPDYATFDSARKFWENGSKGAAEFTSRNFVSVATNFRLETLTRPFVIRADQNHPFPHENAAKLVGVDINDPRLVRHVTDPAPMLGDITFVQTPIVDAYSPSIDTNDRASTLSILYDSVVLEGGETMPLYVPAFTLNSVNYQAAAEFLLPRAAAYSTGLINYFFRGRIGIGLPGEGVYGIVDHATASAAGEGFGRLKLKLSNASPDGEKPSGEAVPQTMQGGTLVAIAKYTLNSCYQPDLSGDFAVKIDTGEVIYPTCSLDQYFAGEEQISQSVAILAATLEKTPAEFIFDFSSQPIPVNARDLRIQVVYTGQLGAEEDGIAFGGRDISEPTHLMIYNNSDYYAVDGTFYTPAQIRADQALSSRVQGLDFDPAALTGVTLAVVRDKPLTEASDAVPVNGYVRAVVLADVDQPFSLNVRSGFERGGSIDSTFAGIWANTTDLRGETAFITPFAIWRGPRTHFVDVVFKANNAVPLADDALTVISGRDAGDPGPTPIPVRF